MIVIKRREEELLKMTKGWILVYGRRKVGKTFTLRRAVNWDLYLTITRTGNVIFEERGKRTIKDQERAIKSAIEALREKKTVIIDEFQRLSSDLMEEIAMEHPNGRLIASSSSFKIVKELFSTRSPLLGLFSTVHFDIIKASDALSSIASELQGKVAPRDLVIWSTLLRDPWAIPMLNPLNKPEQEIINLIEPLIMTSTSLIGEIFEEEERKLTRTYEATMRLIAEGVWDLNALGSVLSSRGLISGGQSVTGIVDLMSKMGIIKKISMWKSRKRFYHKISSPIASVALYVDQKLQISEGFTEKPSEDLLKYPISVEVQFSVGEILAEHYGAKLAYTIMPRGKGDIDAVLLKRGSPIIAFEVKSGKIYEEEVERTRRLAEKLGIRRFGVITLGGEFSGEADVVLNAEDLIKISRNLRA